MTRKVLLIFAVWFFAANAFAVLVANRLNLAGDTAYGWIDPSSYVQERTWNPIPLHSRWDSLWYEDIAADGYSYKGPGSLSNVVFFPLYPALLKLVGAFTGGDLALAGWILSSLCLAAALVFLAKLVRAYHKGADPEIAIALLLVFPTAFFLDAVYSESLFLLLSVLTFYLLLRRNFLAAGAFAFLAAMTRATGLLLVVPVAIEWWQVRGKLKRPWRDAASIVMAPLGTALFFAYDWFRFGDPLIFFKVEATWGRAFALNREHLLTVTAPEVTNLLLDLGFVAFSALMVWLVAKRLRFSYASYMAAAIALPLASGTPMSIGRYIVVLFPIFILLASWKDRRALLGYAFVSVLLFGLYTTLFVNGHWAG